MLRHRDAMSAVRRRPTRRTATRFTLVCVLRRRRTRQKASTKYYTALQLRKHHRSLHRDECRAVAVGRAYHPHSLYRSRRIIYRPAAVFQVAYSAERLAVLANLHISRIEYEPRQLQVARANLQPTALYRLLEGVKNPIARPRGARSARYAAVSLGVRKGETLALRRRRRDMHLRLRHAETRRHTRFGTARALISAAERITLRLVGAYRPLVRTFALLARHAVIYARAIVRRCRQHAVGILHRGRKKAEIDVHRRHAAVMTARKARIKLRPTVAAAPPCKFAERALTVGDVGYLVGFCEQSYFVKVFRRYTGMTPRQYQQSEKRGLSP